MVLAAMRTSRPVTGCDQVLSASARIACPSAPGAGGELKSEPTTENRNCAHKAPVELGCRGVIGVIAPPRKVGKGTVTSPIHRRGKVSDERPLRVECGHREIPL